MLKNFKMSIVLIIIWILIISIGTMMFLSPVKLMKKNENKLDKNLTLTIGDKNTLVTEEFYFYKDRESHIRFDTFGDITNYNTTNVFIDDMEIVHAGLLKIEGPKFLYSSNGVMNIRNIDQYLSKGNHKITIKYYVDNMIFIDEYDNATILNIKKSEDFIYKDIKLEIPNGTKEFLVLKNDELLYQKLNENEYIVNAEKIRTDIEIKLDQGIFNNTWKISGNYIENESDIEYGKIIKFIVKGIIIVISIINFIIIFIITRKKKFSKNYYRETKDVVDIIFAEYMIDKKINSSNLIMSIIIQQIVRGNILYENDQLILKRFDGKSKIKDTILKMFFDTDKKIEIKKIFNIFEDKQKTEENVKKFKEIKKELNKLFYKYDLFNEKSEIILKRTRVLIINTILISLVYLIYLLFGSILAVTALMILVTIEVILVLSKKTKDICNDNFIILFFGVSLIILITIIVNFLDIMVLKLMDDVKIIELIGIFVIILINIKAIKKTYTHIFTKRGVEEYKKIKGLYDYIKDYSLVKERDVDAAIIWDEYLIYATAFGIPNKVTNKFSESLMNTAEMIDKINKIMLME